MSETHVYRCATCGAPIPREGTATRVKCPYCDAENRLVAAEVEEAQAKHARFAQAVKEANDMTAANEKRGETLMRKFEEAQERAMIHGDRVAAEAAVRHMEGYMRLQYAPTIHVYSSMPDDPKVQEALEQIDEVIDQSVSSIAQTLGVEYTKTKDRMVP